MGSCQVPAFLRSPPTACLIVAGDLPAVGAVPCANAAGRGPQLSNEGRQIIHREIEVSVVPPSLRRWLGRPDYHGDDEVALIRLWQEKRGEVEPEDLSGNLIVQLGQVAEELNRRWYEANTGQGCHRRPKANSAPGLHWMAATLDGRIDQRGGVRSRNSCCPGILGRGGRPKNTPQLQHNMWVDRRRRARRFPLLPAAQMVEITDHADPLYQHLIVTADGILALCRELASHLPCLASNHQNHGSRLSGLSI